MEALISTQKPLRRPSVMFACVRIRGQVHRRLLIRCVTSSSQEAQNMTESVKAQKNVEALPDGARVQSGGAHGGHERKVGRKMDMGSSAPGRDSS